jgi:outer membrane protein TolC
MKRLSLLLCLLLLLPSLSSAVPPEAPPVWTAPAAVAFALRNSPDSLIAGQRMHEAEALLMKSAVGFYPQVGLSGSYTQTNNPMYSFGNILNQGAFNPGIDFNNPGRTDNLDVALGVEYRLYNGGQDQARRAAAAAGIDLSAAETEMVRLRLGFEAFRAFQQIVEAESVLRARQVALEAMKSTLEVAQARFAAGDLLKIDLLNLEVQDSRSRENMIQAAHNLELSKQIFLALLGLPAGEVRIDGGAAGPELPAAYSAARRPEILKLKAALRAAEAQLEGAHGSKRPTLDSFASYQLDQGSVTGGNGDSWMAGVRVNFKLFDGRNATADIASGEARIGTLRAELHKLELGLNLEIKQAELALSQAQQRQLVTRKMVEQAEESEQLSRARFQQGVILASDLIDIDSRLTDARVRHAVATSALKIAIADLRRASGLPQFAGSN